MPWPPPPWILVTTAPTRLMVKAWSGQICTPATGNKKAGPFVLAGEDRGWSAATREQVMNIRNVLTSAAVAAILATSGTANAQLLGGGAQGGLGGSLTGGAGNLGATAGSTLNGSLRGGTDALGRTRELGSRATDRAKDTAASAKGQVESTVDGAQSTASGAANVAIDIASDATDSAAATAETAGNAGSSVDLSTKDLSGDVAGEAA